MLPEPLIRRYNRLFYNTRLQFDTERMKKVIEANRQVTNRNFQWINQEILDQSVFNYGIPKREPEHSTANKLSLPINDEISYSDVLCYFSDEMSRVNYLELGVSTGKNTMQILNYINNGICFGYDIEEINPLIKKELVSTLIKVHSWENNRSSKPGKSSFTENYTYKNNQLNYIAADIYDEAGWKFLENKEINVLLSDALHTPDALLFEYEMIKKYNVLAKNKFIMMWDDLGGGMTTSFVKITSDLRKRFNIPKKNVVVLPLNGWIGEHEPKHYIGIIIKE